MEDGEWALAIGGCVVALGAFRWIGSHIVGDPAHPIASGAAFVASAFLTIAVTLIAWGLSKSWKATGVAAAFALLITSTLVFTAVKDKLADNSSQSWSSPTSDSGTR